MSSNRPTVAEITTWKDLSGVPDQSGINVIQAVSDGYATVSLTVENNADGPIPLVVTVDTTPPAGS